MNKNQSIDLRSWLEEVEAINELKKIEGADWDVEIGCITALNVRKDDNYALLFDNIKGYPAGYRLVNSAIATPGREALTLSLPVTHSKLELLKIISEKLPEWESNWPEFTPEEATSGPVLENIHSGGDVDLFEFPSPKWNEFDGGRYIGTGCSVITRDPDSGKINLGTYRIQVHDEKTTGLFAAHYTHGRFHYDAYHARGKPCPVAVSVGHHPLLLAVSSIELQPGAEYGYAGAISGRPIKVIKEEVTGLPIPADSEIVIAGWVPPDKKIDEGPFGEFTGYYSGAKAPWPVIEVERIYHRQNPIMLGAVMSRPPCDSTLHFTVFRSALLYNELVRMRIPDIKAVWLSKEVGGAGLVVVSLKQRYAGHARQASMACLSSRISGLNARSVIAVDDDIDPTNLQEVMWAVGTRWDPASGTDIIKRAPSFGLDPIIRKPTQIYFGSKAIIDACKPYEWSSEFPRVVQASPEIEKRMKKKWGKHLKL